MQIKINFFIINGSLWEPFFVLGVLVGELVRNCHDFQVVDIYSYGSALAKMG